MNPLLYKCLASYACLPNLSINWGFSRFNFDNFAIVLLMLRSLRMSGVFEISIHTGIGDTDNWHQFFESRAFLNVWMAQSSLKTCRVPWNLGLKILIKHLQFGWELQISSSKRISGLKIWACLCRDIPGQYFITNL